MIDSTVPVRLARPSRDLAAAERFYVDGLGLAVLWRTTERVPGEHDLLMVGPPGAAWHFELTHAPERPLEPTPTVDDLSLVRVRDPLPETVPGSARARADKQQQDLTRVHAERDDLRSQAQLLARIVQVLEIENRQLKEVNTNLRGQLAARGAVRDLTQRRRT